MEQDQQRATERRAAIGKLMARWRTARELSEVTHQCPPDGDIFMPCCGFTPFDVPRTGRITENPALATCHGDPRKETRR